MWLKRLNSVWLKIQLLFKWVLGLGIVFCASNFNDPLMARYRKVTLAISVIVFFFVLVHGYQFLRLNVDRSTLAKQYGQIIFLLMLILAIVVLAYDMAAFQYKKYIVLSSPDSLLKGFGQHFIVGYRQSKDILELIEKGAVGGIYITKRNIRNKTFKEVKSELYFYQSVAKNKGLPPLFVAADQEGGKVSHLSGLLPLQPGMADIIDKELDLGRIRSYADTQAVQLAMLGVNLNLSPVVDLKRNSDEHKINPYTRLDQRAISNDADLVTQVAGVYCQALLDHGIRPTLKHFPGLGRVYEETHFDTGNLSGSRKYLEQNDWLPFRKVASLSSPFIMLGHVRVPCVDSNFPVSLSPAVITNVIRKEWGFKGVLITDDFNMGSIAGRSEGIGKAAVRALNAGADIVLLGYDGRQYYNAMYEMLQAYHNGSLNITKLLESHDRIAAFRPNL